MSSSTKRALARVICTLVFCGIGLGHFLRPNDVLAVMPPYLPWPGTLNYVSGFFEILGGIGVWSPWPRLRTWAGYGLVALLVAVFIVNIDMAFYGSPMRNGMIVPEWLLWFRLPWQFILMGVALYGTRDESTHS